MTVPVRKKSNFKTTQPEAPKWKISVRASKSARKPAPVTLPTMSWDKEKAKS